MSDSVQGRLRLKPWLISKIESGTIPGLIWLDRDKKLFRISWKRNGTSDWGTEDSAIFRDWAIHTGKYHEDIDTADYPYWKTRLRCALNKHQEIIEQKHLNMPDGNDPHRVYQIFDNATNDVPLPTQGNEVEMADDFKSPMDVNIGMNIWHATQTNLQNIHNTKEIFHNSVEQFGSGSMDSDLKNISSKDLIPISTEDFHKMQTNFEVIIRFQTEELDKIPVKDYCFLTTSDPEVRMKDCQVIKLPEVGPKTINLQSIMSTIWSSMKDGIYIRFDENKNIYALRLCKCRIYYRNQKNPDGLKLERSDGRTWTLIFDYQEFWEGNRHNLSPNVTLYIGQKGDLNPINVFYSVTICHLYAKQILSDWNISNNNKISISM